MALSEQTRTAIEQALDTYPQRRTAVLDALRLAQNEKGFLGQETLYEVAELMDLDPNALFTLVTFYDLLHDKPVGRYDIMACKNISCYLRGADDLIEHVSKKLGVGLGDTTPDGIFTLRTMECLASCDTAPVMLINETYYENLTIDKVDRILDELSAAHRRESSSQPVAG